MVDGLFTCAVCGKAHNNIADRAKCETACVIKAEEDAKKLEQAKIDGERKESEAAIHKALNNVEAMIESHCEKYNSFSMRNGNYPYLKHIFSRIPLWF